jgi:hypothetical protein
LLTYSRYDLTSTFDVKVKAKIFTLHTTVFTERSEFLRAARKPEWLDNNPNNPVDLEDEDAEVFSTYVNCVYFGPEAPEHYADSIMPLSELTSTENEVRMVEGLQTLIEVYILSDKMQDLVTTNMVIDEVIRFSDIVEIAPCDKLVSLAYAGTP